MYFEGRASDEDGLVDNVQWFFDDQGAQSGLIPVHAPFVVDETSYLYSTPGIFYPRFVALDDDFSAQSASREIVVWTFTPTPTPTDGTITPTPTGTPPTPTPTETETSTPTETPLPQVVLFVSPDVGVPPLHVDLVGQATSPHQVDAFGWQYKNGDLSGAILVPQPATTIEEVTAYTYYTLGVTEEAQFSILTGGNVYTASAHIVIRRHEPYELIFEFARVWKQICNPPTEPFEDCPADRYVSPAPDGKVDAFDLITIVEMWLSLPPPPTPTPTPIK